MARAEAMITERHAEAVERFLSDFQVSAETIDAVGFHGQTVFHNPARALNAGSAGIGVRTGAGTSQRAFRARRAGLEGIGSPDLGAAWRLESHAHKNHARDTVGRKMTEPHLYRLCQFYLKMGHVTTTPRCPFLAPFVPATLPIHALVRLRVLQRARVPPSALLRRR